MALSTRSSIFGCQVTLSGKELQEKNHKSNKLAALFFNKGSNKVRRK